MNDKLRLDPWLTSTNTGDTGISEKLAQEEPPRPDPQTDGGISRPITPYDPENLAVEPGWIQPPRDRFAEARKYLDSLKNMFAPDDTKPSSE